MRLSTPALASHAVPRLISCHPVQQEKEAKVTHEMVEVRTMHVLTHGHLVDDHAPLINQIANGHETWFGSGIRVVSTTVSW